MVEAGVLHRQSGIGASLGRPVPGEQLKGISIVKTIIIVTAGLVAMLSVAAAADLPRKEPPPVAAAPIGKYRGQISGWQVSGWQIPTARRDQGLKQQHRLRRSAQ